MSLPGNRPAGLWRESLAVSDGPLVRLEGWAFLALTALVLPAALVSQGVLWHLIDGGALTQVVRALLFP